MEFLTNTKKENMKIILLAVADVPCGQQLKRGSRIIGGQNAVQGEFPWLVSIKRLGGHFCGGTIVNKRWVITAGHCMCSGSSRILEERIRVSVGEYDLKSKNNKTIDKKVLKIHFHPQYQCAKFVDDIALLELENDIHWTKSVGPACLPTLNLDTEQYSTYSDRSATTAGWGWINEKYGEGIRPDILQKVQVTVVDNEKCRSWYSSQGKKVKILDSQICAGNEIGGRDACWADSGGPLMVMESERMMVVGIVSTGIGCGRPKLPGLYTRMSVYMPWIVKVITE
ncbi:hypothetical protein RUM43_008623 [Polyplax serrata]|uniref:Peptidase S1 domain-containing protein n=1 Tax=Polyplax serrata TaxID=468196 RepID=A0AAN8NMX8_POLSC